MKKSVLFLLALSGCVRLNYVDIPADPSYKFRYVGADAVVECVDKKLAGRMCEKDGKTLANGSHIYFYFDVLRLSVYFDGKTVIDEINYGDDFDNYEQFWISNQKNSYHISYNNTLDKERDILTTKTKLVGASCGGKRYGWKDKYSKYEEKELEDFKRLTDGTNSCDFLKEEDIKQGNPEKKIIFKDAK